jgi:hypothetical protein
LSGVRLTPTLPSQFDFLRSPCACCWVNRCSEGKCGYNLGRESRHFQRVCLSGTKYQSNHAWSGKLCDCLIFWNQPHNGAAAVELKGGKLSDASQSIAQLQAGAVLIETMAVNSEVQFFPVLVHNGVSTAAIKVLNNRKVRFKGRQYSLILERCGCQLQETIQRYG